MRFAPIRSVLTIALLWGVAWAFLATDAMFVLVLIVRGWDDTLMWFSRWALIQAGGALTASAVTIATVNVAVGVVAGAATVGIARKGKEPTMIAGG